MFRQIGQFATSPPLPPPPMLGFLPKHAAKLFQKHKPHSSVSHEEQTALKPTGPQPGFPPPDFQSNTHGLNSSQKNFLCFTFIYYYYDVCVCVMCVCTLKLSTTLCIWRSESGVSFHHLGPRDQTQVIIELSNKLPLNYLISPLSMRAWVRARTCVCVCV